MRNAEVARFELKDFRHRESGPMWTLDGQVSAQSQSLIFKFRQ